VSQPRGAEDVAGAALQVTAALRSRVVGCMAYDV